MQVQSNFNINNAAPLNICTDINASEIRKKYSGSEERKITFTCPYSNISKAEITVPVDITIYDLKILICKEKCQDKEPDINAFKFTDPDGYFDYIEKSRRICELKDWIDADCPMIWFVSSGVRMPWERS